MVLGILNNNEDIFVINDTYITLTPKIKNPPLVKDLSPISLRNVIYKLVSQVIVNRLRGYIFYVIHDNQSTFVEDKLITDNPMVAFEAFNSVL